MYACSPKLGHTSPSRDKRVCIFAISLNIVCLRRLNEKLAGPGVNCIECDALLTIPDDAIQGEIISCKECGATYEVKKDEASGLITLKPAEKEQEDWGE